MNLKSFKKDLPEEEPSSPIKFTKGDSSTSGNLSKNPFSQDIQINIKSNNSRIRQSSSNLVLKKKHLPVWKKIGLTFLVLLVVLGSIGGYLYWSKIQDLRNTGVEGVGLLSPLDIIKDKFVDPDKEALAKLDQTDGRTNILTIGIDARSNDGSLLTDSMIVNSYDHASNRVVQFSMPRDLLAPYNNHYDKLNSVFPFSYSNAKQANKTDEEAAKQGMKDLSETIEKISGVKIHYGMLINFQGFKELVDQIGGVEIDVENSFTDYTYPNDNDTGVITVSFKAGKQVMNGTRALQYSRSRHSADNNEGTDFARARRQQKVINAIRDKVLGSDTMSKLDFINKTIDVLGKNIKFYNISTDDISNGIQALDKLKETKISGFVVDTSIGSYPEQVLKGGSNGKCYGLEGYYACAVKSMGDYSAVEKIIKFNLANPDYVAEKAATEIVWTNSRRYKDYDKLRDNMILEYLPLTYYEYVIYTAPAASGTVTPTEEGASAPFVTIYTKSDSPKPATVDVYKKFFDSKGFTYTEKSSAEAPKELKNVIQNNDIILAIE